MVDFVVALVAVFALVVLGLLVAIYAQLRRGRSDGVSAEVMDRLAPLQGLASLKESADQKLPLLVKQTSDLGEWVLQSHKRLAEHEKALGESLVRLHEATKKTPELSDRVLTLQTEFKRLQHVEQGVQELTKLFLSTQGRGLMGEEAVRNQFQALPPDLWSEQFPLGGGKVDFAIHMPNRRILPIDSKTSGLQPILEYVQLGQKIAQTSSSEEKESLLAQQGKVQTRIRQAVLGKTYEVAQYIQPANGTLGIAVQAVPDSLYNVLDIKTRKEASEQNVQLVPYGLLLPVIHMLRSQNQYDKLDLQSVVAAMQGIRLQSNAVRDVLVNKFEKAQRFIETGVIDVREALAAIERNAESVADEGGVAVEGRDAVRAVRGRWRQKGLVEP